MTRAISRWSCEAASRTADQLAASLPVFNRALLPRIARDLDVWDMWPLTDRSGATIRRRGREVWFFLAAPSLNIPNAVTTWLAFAS